MTDGALIGPTDAPDLHVMTYNIRRRLRKVLRTSPDLWSRRKWLLRQLLTAERPSLLGVQEGLTDQVEFVAGSLGRSYRRIGFGRDADGRGESCPIFYDAARLQVRDWTQLALSTTPEVAGSRSWGNMVPRIAIRATMTDLATGSEFVVFNTHLDHLSRKSRLRSAQMLGELVLASKLPAIVMGDANTSVDTAPYRELARISCVEDVWDVAGERVSELWGTFPNYRDPNKDGKRIDWLLVTPSIGVRKAGINITRYAGAAPSDHHPVQATLRIPSGEPAIWPRMAAVRSRREA